MAETLIWVAIVICITQSAIFSGMNIAVFSLSRLRLEAAAAAGEKNAAAALELRRDANLTLVTILIGNVSINVLLTMLADSVLAGVLAFLFSTVIITAIGEIAPQAYFSRNALNAVSLLAPILRLYRTVLWPVAKPTALLLDAWVGTEAVPWFRERELHNILQYHAANAGSEVGRIEAIGATNFLALDDLVFAHQGTPLHPDSIVTLPFQGPHPVFPQFAASPADPFMRKLGASGRKWIVLVSDDLQPRLLLNAHAMLRDVLMTGTDIAAEGYCHAPAIVTDPQETLDRGLDALASLRQCPGKTETVILLWSADNKRILTGTDVLRCLLSGMASRQKPDLSAASPA